MVAVTASVVSTGAFASSNMENPLYMPKNREVYLKTGAAVMYKKADSTEATRKRGMDGDIEFPIWRFAGDIGYGITDRLDVHGRFGYTHDEDISRQGMHRGRIGLTYRVLTEEKPLVLDLYADAYLSGVSPMKGTYTPKGFKFDNYSNGRYGIIAGTRFGKTWNKFTAAAHVEYLQTFGNHNNEIAIAPDLTPLAGNPKITKNPYLDDLTKNYLQSITMSKFGFPNEIAVNLKSTHETVAGFDLMYQMDSQWSFGAGFEYIEHTDNGVKSIHTKLDKPDSTVTAMIDSKTSAGMTQSLQNSIVDGLLAETKNMKDGWDEYVIKASVANQITDSIQLAFFAEYTFDDSHSGSQNGTDIKAEAGFRFNARF